MTPTSSETSDQYFLQRSYESQIGAWASKQSTCLESPKELSDRMMQYKNKFPNEVPRPPNWGGYLLLPYEVEFWYDEPHRLHLRQLFQLAAFKEGKLHPLWQSEVPQELQKLVQDIRQALSNNQPWQMSFLQP